MLRTAPRKSTIRARSDRTGESDPATQLNTAPAQGNAVVSTITTPNNVVVAVVVPGSPENVVVPTGNTPWVWNWTWTTGQAPIDPTAAPTSSPNWQWTWTAPPGGATPAAAPTTSSSSQPQSGQWTWTWNWTRPDGTTTSWTYSQACSCSWAWSWSWNWPTPTSSNTPAAAPAAAPAPLSKPAVDQRNESSATAVAITTFSGTQSVAVAAESASTTSASTAQALASTQDAQAVANVTQDDPLNQSVVTAGEIDGLDQSNTVSATAIGHAADDSIQTMAQQQSGTRDGANHSLSATQWIETVQVAEAGVAATQSRARNHNHVWSGMGPSQAKLGKVTQKNTAETLALADVESTVRQVVQEVQIRGGADQDASAGQSATTTQAQNAFSSVSQARVTNVNAVSIPLYGSWNPPLDQSNHVSAVSTSYATSAIEQTIAQSESGAGIEWHASATQEAVVNQSDGTGDVRGIAVRSHEHERLARRRHAARLDDLDAAGNDLQAAERAVRERFDAERVRSVRRGRLIGRPSRPPRGGAGLGQPGPGTRAQACRREAARDRPQDVPRLGRPHGAAAGADVFIGAVELPVRNGGTVRRGRPGAVALEARQPQFRRLDGGCTPALLPAAFAVRPEPIELAVPGVGRLQRDAPILGRSVDTSLRERPG
jgi:hypothetical protein